MGKIIGLDTSIFIYLLEEHPTYFLKCQSLLHAIESGNAQGVFSAIGLIEILTGPKQLKEYELAAKYRHLITSFPHITLIGLNERIIEIASDLRAMYGVKTPDAIHLATAIDSNASEFVTNDKSLKRVKEIRVTFL